MRRHERPRVLYSARLLAEDMGARGWSAKDLARIAAVSERTVSRFLRNEFQTAKMAGRLARALGFSPRRYLIRETESVGSAR
jgi:plasmid maintenance system antidote protein VapI